jgi:hypothetical protein
MADSARASTEHRADIAPNARARSRGRAFAGGAHDRGSSRDHPVGKYQRAEFLEHYHKRSNVETTFHMIKSKFGDAVLSKSEPAQG